MINNKIEELLNTILESEEYIKYKEIGKLKDVDFIEYVKQKEVLFIKDDMKKIEQEQCD